MSSVSLSASGARSLSTTINDPARTSASIPTKAGDCISLSGGSLGAIRMNLPPNALIERKRVKAGDDVRETWQLVLPTGGSGMIFIRPANETAWPHLSVDVRQWPADDVTQPYLELGEVVESYSLADLGIAEHDLTDESNERLVFVGKK